MAQYRGVDPSLTVDQLLEQMEANSPEGRARAADRELQRQAAARAARVSNPAAGVNPLDILSRIKPGSTDELSGAQVASRTPPAPKPVPTPPRALPQATQAVPGAGGGGALPTAVPAAAAASVGNPQGAGGGVLQQATAAAAGEPPPDVSFDSMLRDSARRRGVLDAQLTQAYEPQDYTELSEKMRARGRDAGTMNMAAAMAALGPQSMQGIQKGMLERAQALGGDLKVSGGVITADGQQLIDPGHQAQRKIELIAKRLDSLDKLDASLLTAREKADVAREKLELLEMLGLLKGRGRGGGAGGGEGGDGHGKLEIGQFVNRDTGSPVTYDKTSGAFYERIVLPDGSQRTVMADPRKVMRHGDVPPTGVGGDTLPANAPAATRTHYDNATKLLATVPRLVADVERNPQAFGLRVGAAETVGGAAGVGGHQVPLLGKQLTEQQQATRSQVYLRYAQLLNELIGSAQTAGEITRLRAFTPGVNEDAAGIVRKMKGAIEEATRSRSAARQSYGLPDAPAGGGGAALPGARGADATRRAASYY